VTPFGAAGYWSEEDRKICLDAGFETHLAKPVETRSLGRGDPEYRPKAVNQFVIQAQKRSSRTGLSGIKPPGLAAVAADTIANPRAIFRRICSRCGSELNRYRKSPTDDHHARLETPAQVRVDPAPTVEPPNPTLQVPNEAGDSKATTADGLIGLRDCQAAGAFHGGELEDRVSPPRLKPRGMRDNEVPTEGLDCPSWASLSRMAKGKSAAPRESPWSARRLSRNCVDERLKVRHTDTRHKIITRSGVVLHVGPVVIGPHGDIPEAGSSDQGIDHGVEETQWLLAGL
jgi:hypothetical protein